MSPPTGHYYARWDDTDGISVVWEGMDLMDLAFYLRPDDLDVNGNPVDPGAVGLYNMAMAPETITEVVFDPDSGKVLEQGLFKQDWTFNLQLSAMDWSTEGMSSPTLHHVTYQGCRPGNISRRAAELYEGRIDLDQVREDTPGALCSFERGEHGAEGALGVPRRLATTSPHRRSPPAGSALAAATPGGEPGGHDGYVVQPVCSDNGFRVERVRRRQRVGRAGRHARRRRTRSASRRVLHSAWMPAYHELADAERLRFSDELSDERMASVPEELHAAVRAVAEECDSLG